MLAGALRASLRAPAVRATPTAFRTASIQQWSRGYAKVGKPSTPEFKKDAPVSAAPSFSSPKQKVDEKATPAADKADPEFSTEQSEFKTNAEPAENKAKQVEEDVEDKLPEGFKLPDLRGGLPSTLEFETTGQSATQSAKSALNLTEDPEKEGPTPGSGKGPKKELPDSAYVSSNEKKRLRVANYMYAATLVAVVGGAIYLGRDWDSEEERLKHTDVPTGWSPTAMWARFRARTGDQLEYYAEPAFKKLLPDPDPSFERPYTLVLSLEDLLIHSEWSREHGWRMAKRPGVDYFLRYLSQYYELVVFTSVPWAVAEPIIKKLDPYHIITWPLFREATVYKNGKYVKDLTYLNRDLSKVIIMDTSADHVGEQPQNAIVLPKWTGDARDTTLVSHIPFLEYIATMQIPDVRAAIKSFEGSNIPVEFAKREAIARKKFQEQLAIEKKKGHKGGVGFLGKALGIKPQAAYEGEPSVGEAFAQGKMLQDLARERGQKNYEALEKMIREQGEQWLREEKDQEERAKQEGMQAMKSTMTGFFGTPTGEEKK